MQIVFIVAKIKRRLKWLQDHKTTDSGIRSNCRTHKEWLL